MNKNTTAAQPLNAEHAELLNKQVADWRKEIARLQDLIAHATGLTGAAQPLDLDNLSSALNGALSNGNRGTSGRLILDRRTEELLREAAETIAQARAAQPAGAATELPAILFDGKAVYDEVQAHTACRTRTSPENVADALDAVVRLMRKAGAADTTVSASGEPVGNSPGAKVMQWATIVAKAAELGGRDDGRVIVLPNQAAHDTFAAWYAGNSPRGVTVCTRIASQPVQAGEAVDESALFEAWLDTPGMMRRKLYNGSNKKLIFTGFQAGRATLAPVAAQQAAAIAPWEYCPECGCMETAEPEEGCGYFCANFKQEWHADIDYSEVVRKNLERLAAAKAPAAQAVAVNVFTCKGKGGEYELVGHSNGAGQKRGENIVVYRDTTKPDIFYHRSRADFEERMEWLGARAATPASTPEASQQAAAVAAPILYARPFDLEGLKSTHKDHGVMTSPVREEEWTVPLYTTTSAVAATTSEDARYRWLRDEAIYQQEGNDGWYEIKVPAPLQDDVGVTAEQFDMQVQAAMRATQQEGE